MGSINIFWNALNSDEGKKLLKSAKMPENEEEAAELYSSIAAKLDVKAPKEDVLNLLKVKEKIQQKQTEKAENSLKEALNDDQMDSVAGGGGDLYGKQESCESTFNPEGEWCWVSDSCTLIVTDYSDVAYIPYNPASISDIIQEECEGGLADWNVFTCKEVVDSVDSTHGTAL